MSKESPNQPECPEGGADGDENDGPLDRRGFLKLAAGVIAAGYAGAIGYPVYRYIASPVEQAAMASAVTEVTLDNALSLPLNSSLIFKFGTTPALLIHHADGTFTALAAVCTHLGCTVNYNPEKKVIFCPCHSGVYNAQTGANISGPPPKPLKQYQVTISNGKVVISRA